MEENISQLFNGLPEETKVLDIGGWGLEGENTSLDIIRSFKDVTNITKSNEVYNRFRATYAQQKWHHGWWPEIANKVGKFDLIVSDLNIDWNLKEWSPEGLQVVREHLNDGGFYITWVMLTDAYGDAETPELIRNHWKEWWGSAAIDPVPVFNKLNSLEGWTLTGSLIEPRRPTILWIKLQKSDKTTGSSASSVKDTGSTVKPAKKAPSKKVVTKK